MPWHRGQWRLRHELYEMAVCYLPVRALIAMSTQRGSAATSDGEQHLFVLSVDPLATALNEGLSCPANDVGHLQGEAGSYVLYLFSLCPDRQGIQRNYQVALRCRRERCR